MHYFSNVPSRIEKLPRNISFDIQQFKTLGISRQNIFYDELLIFLHQKKQIFIWSMLSRLILISSMK